MLTDLLASKNPKEIKKVIIGNMWKSSSNEQCGTCGHTFKPYTPFYSVMLELHDAMCNVEYQICQVCNNVTIARK